MYAHCTVRFTKLLNVLYNMTQILCKYPTSRCRNHIILEDLEAFLNPEQAVEAFAMLDNNGDGKLVLADIRDAVIKIYKERRNLALSLKVLMPHRCACSMFQ